MKFITIKSFVIYKCIHLFLFNIDNLNKFSYNVVLYIFEIIYKIFYIFIYIQYSKQMIFFIIVFPIRVKKLIHYIMFVLYIVHNVYN